MRATSTAGAALAVLASLMSLLGACSYVEDPDRPGVPAYDDEVTGPGEVVIRTMATSPHDLRAIFDDVHRDRTEEDWWRVTISCSTIPAVAGIDPRLATGRFANTQVGLAETGLASRDDVEFRTTGRTDCTPLAPTVPGAVLPDRVVAAVEGAGLPVPNARDSSVRCNDLECLQHLSSDVITVIVWPTPEAADRWVAGFVVDAVKVGPVTTVSFADTQAVTGHPRDAYADAVATLG